MQFFVCFTIFFIFLSLPASATGFEYRVPIAIDNNGQELTDFQVKVTLDTEKLVVEDKISPSCADVRFTDSGSFDNSSWAKTYPFWVDYLTCNTTETVFWVKLDKVPVGKKVIYAYYGAEKPEFGSTGKETFDFYQDFEDESVDYNNRQPAGWTENRYADVSVTDLEAFRGEKSMEVEGNSEADWSAYRLLPEQRESYVLEFEALPAQEGGALTVGTQSPWPLLQFGRCGANEIPAGHWGYSKHWYDRSWQMNWNDGGAYEKGKWYGVSLRFDGKNLEMDLNGERVLEKTEVSAGGLSDRITVAGDSDCSAGWGVGGYIDTIRVRKYSAIEPVVFVGNEETVFAPESATVQNPFSFSPGDGSGSVPLNPSGTGLLPLAVGFSIAAATATVIFGVSKRIKDGDMLLTETTQHFAQLWESKAGYRGKKRAYEGKLREERNRELWIQKVKDNIHGEARENVIELIRSGYIEAEELPDVVPAFIEGSIDAQENKGILESSLSAAGDFLGNALGNAKVLGEAVLDFVGNVPFVGKPIINYVDALRDFVVEQSEQIKKSSDAIGLIGIGLIAGGVILSFTGVGAAPGISLIGVGLGAVSGAMDITIWGAKESTGKADEDDEFRAAIAPLSFIGAGVGGKGAKELLKGTSQLSKQLQKEAGQANIFGEYKKYAQLLFDKKGKSVPFYNWAGERMVYAGRKFLKDYAVTFPNGKIYINTRIPKGLEVPALIHEIIHAEIVKGKGFLKDLVVNGDTYLKSGKKLLEKSIENFKGGAKEFDKLVHDVFVDTLALKIDPVGTAKLLKYRLETELKRGDVFGPALLAQFYHQAETLLKNKNLAKQVLDLIEAQPGWLKRDVWKLYGDFVKIGKLADVSIFTKLETDLAKITVNQGGLITSIYELIKKDYGTMDNIIDKGREFDIVDDSGKKVRNGFK